MVKTFQAAQLAHDRFSSVQLNFHKVVKKCHVKQRLKFSDFLLYIEEYQSRATVFGIDMF